jgi:tetratricopeptide (TPR) repeat protein
MGEAAREEARQALKLEPKLAPVYRHLGWVLEHDEIGRRFGPGYDRAGALAALRKAKELDPKDQTARSELAILLEQDAEGVRYSPRADLGAAIDEYKALKKDLGAKGVDDNLLVALVRAGRFAEAKELAAQMKGSQKGSVLSLVAIAATDGVEAAVREGEHAYSDDKERAEALQTAAQTLTLVRRYPEAAALMERASRQSDNAAALLSMADLLRKTRRHEEIPLPADKPTTPARRLLFIAIDGKPDLKQRAAIFTHDVAAEAFKLSPQEIQRLFDAGSAMVRRQVRSLQVPIEAALDLGFGSLQETVSGDEASGYRVALAFPGAAGKRPGRFVVYVVRDGGEYRIAALSAVPAMLGDEALRRVQRGDLAGARQWLDWAREEMPEDAGGGSEPLPASAFLVLWPTGSSGGAEEARCAAATLLAAGESTRAIPLLRSCRETAGDPARHNALDMALALADLQAKHLAEAEEISHRLLAGAPGSERAERLQAQALMALGRWDDLRKLAGQRLQRSADDPWALRLLTEADLRAGDLVQAEARLRQILKSGKATADDYNEIAWLLLERGQVDDEALDFGQRAATLSEYRQAPYLHTLASLYAEKGRTAEAYRILVQSIDARADANAGPDDWYVFGRLAEQYGLPDVARKYYKRVPAPASPEREAMSTHALVTRRLAALGEEKKTQSRATL